MEILKFNNSKKQIDEIVKQLKDGRVIACPSETCYGLTCDSSNPNTVEKIFKIKNRPFKKTVIVVVSSLAMAKEYARFNPLAIKLAKKYWPGPLTMVLPAREKFLKLKGIDRKRTVAIRYTSDKLLVELSRKLKGPVVSTSANLMDEPNIYSGKKIIETYKDRRHQPSLVVDAGRIKKVKPSTLILVHDNDFEILRKGPVKCGFPAPPDGSRAG